MFPSFIVTFREVLEIALVVGVILAATHGLVGRNRWIALGFGGGIAGSCLVALFTDSIAHFAQGLGQELFNAMILLTASFIIGWTAVWMRIHAREMVAQIKTKGGKIVEGELPKITLSAIITLAVLREGSEIVLFTYGMLASGQPPMTVLTGSLLGMAVGGLVGTALYIGMIKIPTRYIFQVTTWVLLLLTAGMSAVAAKYLVSAGYFTQWSQVLWDSSFLLKERSLPGQFFHALLGYTERPMLIQLIFYVVTLVSFVATMQWLQFHSKHSASKGKEKLAKQPH